jgi:hypothetical protein
VCLPAPWAFCNLAAQPNGYEVYEIVIDPSPSGEVRSNESLGEASPGDEQWPILKSVKLARGKS